MRINLAAFENGVGNSRDLSLMATVLASLGCHVEVTRVSVEARRRRRSPILRAVTRGLVGLYRRRGRPGGHRAFDVAVLMEHVWPEQLRAARCNVIVPNPEWFDRHDLGVLGCADRVWSKTAHTERAFAALGCRTSLIGFDSEDRYLADVPRETAFLHLAGKSRMKGTARLLAAWSRHPEWPTLTVVRSAGRDAPLRAANIRWCTDYLDDAELRALQNRHAFHVCSSETEGWGHYIPEALSAGAVVLATDAPPMNEMVSAERGLLLGCAPFGRQHLATTYRVEEAAIEAGVAAALALDAAARARLGAAARDWFHGNKAGFPGRVRAALEALG